MEFRLNIHADNEAFEPEPAHEIARILRDISHRIESGMDLSSYRTLFDINGNDVGRVALKERDRF